MKPLTYILLVGALVWGCLSLDFRQSRTVYPWFGVKLYRSNLVTPGAVYALVGKVKMTPRRQGYRKQLLNVQIVRVK